MLQELMRKEDKDTGPAAAPDSEQAPHRDPQPQQCAPGTHLEEREQEQQRPTDNNFTNDEWSSCVKVGHHQL
jgi:hypothetical protein